MDGEGDGVDGGWSTHMVRGTWLSKSRAPPNYGLPPPLLDHLRSALGAEVNGETERAVLEAVISIFSPMLEGIGADDLDRFRASSGRKPTRGSCQPCPSLPWCL